MTLPTVPSRRHCRRRHCTVPSLSEAVRPAGGSEQLSDARQAAQVQQPSPATTATSRGPPPPAAAGRQPDQSSSKTPSQQRRQAVLVQQRQAAGPSPPTSANDRDPPPPLRPLLPPLPQPPQPLPPLAPSKARPLPRFRRAAAVAAEGARLSAVLTRCPLQTVKCFVTGEGMEGEKRRMCRGSWGKTCRAADSCERTGAAAIVTRRGNCSRNSGF